MRLRPRLTTAWSASLLISAFVAADAMAVTRLATEGNVYLPNPYPDPANSYHGFRIASGDFNGDAIDDMVVAELGYSTRIRVLLGKPYPIGGSSRSATGHWCTGRRQDRRIRRLPTIR